MSGSILPADLAVRPGPRLSRLDRPMATILSLAIHGLLLLIVFQTLPKTPDPVEPPAVEVEILAPPAPVIAPEAGAPPAATAPTKVEKPARPKPTPPVKSVARLAKKPPPPRVRTLAAAKTAPEEPEEPVPEVSEAQLASAHVAGSGSGAGAGAGSGSGGGSCDMARAIANALRRDPLVARSVAQAHAAGRGKAMLVWNGDWVRSHSQDGRGLSAVREAIIWEVGFAPEACRNQPMRGLVLFNLTGGRLVLGQDRWRWSDLLGLKR